MTFETHIFKKSITFPLDRLVGSVSLFNAVSHSREIIFSIVVNDIKNSNSGFHIIISLMKYVSLFCDIMLYMTDRDPWEKISGFTRLCTSWLFEKISWFRSKNFPNEDSV